MLSATWCGARLSGTTPVSCCSSDTLGTFLTQGLCTGCPFSPEWTSLSHGACSIATCGSLLKYHLSQRCPNPDFKNGNLLSPSQAFSIRLILLWSFSLFHSTYQPLTHSIIDSVILFIDYRQSFLSSQNKLYGSRNFVCFVHWWFPSH